MCKSHFIDSLIGELGIDNSLGNFTGRRCRDHMAVGFITAYAISAHYLLRCEIQPRLGGVYLIQRYVVKFGIYFRDFIYIFCSLLICSISSW